MRARPSVERLEGILLLSAVANDFNGDGRADFVAFDRSTATYTVAYSSDPGTAIRVQVGNPRHTIIPVPGDYDGDGRVDFAVYDATVGTFFVKLARDPTVVGISAQLGDPTHSDSIVPVPADYSGTGRTDFAVFDRTTSTYLVKFSSNPGVLALTSQIGDPAHSSSIVPVPADYTGDGRADFGIYDRTVATYFVKSATDPGGLAIAAPVGDPSHANSNDPVPADYSGTNRTDFGVFDRTTATYYVNYASNPGALALTSQIGDPGHVSSIVPVPADYTGGGRADFAIFDKVASIYYVKSAANPGALALVSAIGDRAHASGIDPIPADYSGDGRADFAIQDATVATDFVKYSTAPNTLALVAQVGSPARDNLPIANANVNINGAKDTGGALITDPLIVYDRLTSTYIAPQVTGTVLVNGVPTTGPLPNTVQVGDPTHVNAPVINANVNINGAKNTAGAIINDPLIVYDKTTSTFVAPLVIGTILGPGGVPTTGPLPNTVQLGDPSHENIPIVNANANINGARDTNGNLVNDALIVYDKTTSTFIAPPVRGTILVNGVPTTGILPNTLRFGDPTHDNVPIVNANTNINGAKNTSGALVTDPLILYDRTTATFVAPPVQGVILGPGGVPTTGTLPNTVRVGDPTHDNMPIVNANVNINGAKDTSGALITDPLIVYDGTTSTFVAQQLNGTVLVNGVPTTGPLPNTVQVGDPTHVNAPVINANVNINGAKNTAGAIINDALIVYDQNDALFVAPIIIGTILGPGGVPTTGPLPNTLPLGDPAHDNVAVVNANLNINGARNTSGAVVPDALIVYDRTASTFVAPPVIGTVLVNGVPTTGPLPNTLKIGAPSPGSKQASPSRLYAL